MKIFKAISIVFFLLIYISVNAQNARIDILKKNTSSASIKEKINAFLQLADFQATKNFDSCILLTNQGIQFAAEINDFKSMGEFKKLHGLGLYFKGNYDSAAWYYYKALEDMTMAKSLSGRASVLNELGKLYRKTKDLDRALQNYDEAYQIFVDLKDEGGMSTILNESGVVFEYKGDYKEAINRYTRCLNICQKSNDSVCMAYSLSFIGGAYLLQKNYELAESYLLKSLAYREKLRDTFTLALSHTDIGVLYFESKQYAKSIVQNEASYRIATKMKYLELQMTNLKNLSDIAAAMGEHSKAFAYYKNYTALKDSIMSEGKIKQIEELNARYQSEKKEQQLQVQQLKIQKTNYFLWGSISFFTLAMFSLFSVYKKKQVQNAAAMQFAVMQEQDRATRAVIEAEENERQRIAADLHDGIGQMMSVAKMNLSTFEHELSFSTDQQKTAFEKVMKLVDESCKEIRSVSHQMMPNALLKSGLAFAIKEFIEKIDNRIIRISLHTEGLDSRVDNNTETVLYRIIQECVNNVLKHAKASTLDISVIRDEDGISTTIEDDGIGFNIEDKRNFDGIGLKNIVTRVNFLKGSIEFDSGKGKGTLVAIHVPLTS